MAGSRDGKFLYTCDGGGSVKQFSTVRFEEVYDFGKLHDFGILSASISLCGRWLFTSDEDGNVKQWNVRTNSLAEDWGRKHEHGIRAVDVLM